MRADAERRVAHRLAVDPDEAASAAGERGACDCLRLIVGGHGDELAEVLGPVAKFLIEQRGPRAPAAGAERRAVAAPRRPCAVLRVPAGDRDRARLVGEVGGDAGDDQLGAELERHRAARDVLASGHLQLVPDDLHVRGVAREQAPQEREVALVVLHLQPEVVGQAGDPRRQPGRVGDLGGDVGDRRALEHPRPAGEAGPLQRVLGGVDGLLAQLLGLGNGVVTRVVTEVDQTLEPVFSLLETRSASSATSSSAPSGPSSAT